MPEIKFCGLTRPEDARHAATLGASYIGVIFAESPRRVTDAQARLVYGAAPASVKRVAVFGAESAQAIADRASSLQVQVVQLHADPDTRILTDVRQRWSGDVWAVLRLDGDVLPDSAAGLFALADAVVLDTRSGARLGGTGVALPWERIRERLGAVRGRGRLVLAGGLRPENVTEAVKILDPDVVDVSSGVESEVGVKDHGRMRAFRDAVHTATIS